MEHKAARVALLKYSAVDWPVSHEVINKPHCHYQNFSPLANGLYLIATTNKTPLHNGNFPITDPITKKGVADTVGLWRVEEEPVWEQCLPVKNHLQYT